MASSSSSAAAGLGRRERRRADTERRIIEAALRLFSEHGCLDTTVDEIAAAADIGKGTFFNYFPSKERLILAFGENLVERLATAAASIKPDVPIREQLRAAIHLVIGEWHENRRLLRSILGSALSSDQMARHFQDLLACGRSNVALLMEEGQRRGELRDDVSAADLARLLQQSMFGAQLVWSLLPRGKLGAAVDQMLDVLWCGVQARPTTMRPPLRRGAS